MRAGIIFAILFLLLASSYAMGESKVVRDKMFVLVNNTWVDSSCKNTTPEVVVDFGSEAYYRLLLDNKTSEYLTVGDSVVFCTDRVVMIYNNGRYDAGANVGESVPLAVKEVAKDGEVVENKEMAEPAVSVFFRWFAVLVLVLAAFVVFSIMMRKPVTVEVEVYKVLSSDTRRGILGELLKGDRIPTDLSSMLGKSKSTIVEHLDKLIEAELVERIEQPGKKFVFYRITPKGKSYLRTAS